MTARRRFVLLLACLGAGAIVGAAGTHTTGNEWWWLALPIALAAGWLWVGTPEKCVDPDRRT